MLVFLEICNLCFFFFFDQNYLSQVIVFKEHCILDKVYVQMIDSWQCINCFFVFFFSVNKLFGTLTWRDSGEVNKINNAHRPCWRSKIFKNNNIWLNWYIIVILIFDWPIFVTFSLNSVSKYFQKYPYQKINKFIQKNKIFHILNHNFVFRLSSSFCCYSD